MQLLMIQVINTAFLHLIKIINNLFKENFQNKKINNLKLLKIMIKCLEIQKAN